MRAASSKARRAVLAAITAAFLAPGMAAAPAAVSLDDQYGRSVDVRIGEGRPVVVIASDQREAAEQIAAWSEALTGLPVNVDVYRIADLKALPFFVPRGAVAKDLREKHPDMPLLLDWKGDASARLKAPKKTTSVLAFGSDGTEEGRVAGTASLSGAYAVKEIVARLK
jgi:hypothetical protein